MSRPKENRIALKAHVLPKTARRIARLVNKRRREVSTIGRVVDTVFGKVKEL